VAKLKVKMVANNTPQLALIVDRVPAKIKHAAAASSSRTRDNAKVWRTFSDHQ
jgi:hypothetical protein